MRSREAQQPQCNSYYLRPLHRPLHKKYGFIDELHVPQDRNGEFQTQVFEPYQRSSWLAMHPQNVTGCSRSP
ncbi:transposase [Paenibacillus sp. IITD108]|uniref:transposase n=1 Tax=Paenibacillus sp. IITD108 TaxID=3116649 RepID=UPI003FA745C4